MFFSFFIFFVLAITCALLLSLAYNCFLLCMAALAYRCSCLCLPKVIITYKLLLPPMRGCSSSIIDPPSLFLAHRCSSPVVVFSLLLLAHCYSPIATPCLSLPLRCYSLLVIAPLLLLLTFSKGPLAPSLLLFLSTYCYSPLVFP